jgi:hypothetical protein
VSYPYHMVDQLACTAKNLFMVYFTPLHDDLLFQGIID